MTAVVFTTFPGGLEGKASVYNAEDPCSIPGSGRSPGEENGNPLRYYCLENPIDRGAWQATVHGVAKSQTRLSNFTFNQNLRNGELNETKMFTWGLLGLQPLRQI